MRDAKRGMADGTSQWFDKAPRTLLPLDAGDARSAVAELGEAAVEAGLTRLAALTSSGGLLPSSWG